MKKFFYAIAGLIVVTVALVLVAPSFIDWNRYKGDVAAAVREATGRDLAITGDLDLAFLPTPHLVASDLRLASFAGAAEPDMIRLSGLRLRVALVPLLRGRLAVTSLVLVEPVIVLEESADGRASWRFTPPQGPAGGAAPGGVDNTPLAVSVERVAIENGTLIWRGRQAAEPLRFEQLEAEGSMAGPQGPFKITATARRGDVPVTLALTTGTLREGQPLPVRLNLDLADGAAVLALSADADTAARQIRGKLKIAGPDAAALAAVLGGGPSPSVPTHDFAIETTALITGDSANFANLQARLGGTSGVGTLSASFGTGANFTGALRIRNFDLDAWLAGREGAAADNGGGAAPEPTVPALPRDVTGHMELVVDALRYRGGLVRDAKLTAGLSGGTLSVTRAGARLPGGTDFSLTGEARPWQGSLRFDGDLAATSDNLRAMLDWLGVDGDSLPADRLRGFSWTSRVAVLPETISLSRITARLDATRISGGMTIARRDRPSLGVRLEIDRLNLDNYLPEPADRQPAGKGGGGDASGQGIPALGDFDANIDVTAGSLNWRGATMARVRFDAQLFKGVATIRKATIGDLDGAAVRVSGKISDLPGTPKPALDITLDGHDPERFLRLIGLSEAIKARALGRFKLTAGATGTLADLSVSGRLDALGGVVSGQGRLTGLPASPEWDFSLKMDNPDAERLLALAGMDRKPSGQGLGAIEAAFRIAGDAGAIRITGLDASVAGAPVKGEVSIGLGATRPTIDAALSAGVVSLDRLLGDDPKQAAAAPKRRGDNRWSRETIDLSGLRGFDLNLALVADALLRGDIRLDRAVVMASLADGVLTLQRVAGTVFGGAIEASGTLNTKGGEARANGVISGRDLDSRGALLALAGIERLDGPISIDLTVQAAGASEFALVSSLAGSGRITGKVRARVSGQERTQAGIGGIVGALLGDKVKEIGRAGDAVGTLLRSFADAPADLAGDFAIARGRVRTDNLVPIGRDARALSVGVANLPGWLIDSRTTLRRDGDGADPYMTVRLTGRLDEPNVKSGGTWLRGQRKAPRKSTGVKKTPSALAPAEQPEPPKPEQLFLDILKSLSR